MSDTKENQEKDELNCNVHQLGSISLIFPITKPKVLKIAPLNISRIRVC